MFEPTRRRNATESLFTIRDAVTRIDALLFYLRTEARRLGTELDTLDVDVALRSDLLGAHTLAVRAEELVARALDQPTPKMAIDAAEIAARDFAFVLVSALAPALIDAVRIGERLEADSSANGLLCRIAEARFALCPTDDRCGVDFANDVQAAIEESGPRTARERIVAAVFRAPIETVHKILIAQTHLAREWTTLLGEAIGQGGAGS